MCLSLFTITRFLYDNRDDSIVQGFKHVEIELIIYREKPKKRFPREKIDSWFIIQNNSNTIAEEPVSSKNITLPHSDDIIAADDR